jgi:hypothetical protein
MSTSGCTISGEFEPSSSSTFLRGAAAAMPQPTGTEPVKDTTAGTSWLDQRFTGFGPPVGHHRDPVGGQTGLDEEVDERQGSERGLGGGLEHDRTAGGDGGGQLVGHQVEREVERRDGGDHPRGHAQGEGQLATPVRRGLDRDHLSGELAGSGGGEGEGVDRIAPLDPGGA